MYFTVTLRISELDLQTTFHRHRVSQELRGILQTEGAKMFLGWAKHAKNKIRVIFCMVLSTFWKLLRGLKPLSSPSFVALAVLFQVI